MQLRNFGSSYAVSAANEKEREDVNRSSIPLTLHRSHNVSEDANLLGPWRFPVEKGEYALRKRQEAEMADHEKHDSDGSSHQLRSVSVADQCVLLLVLV